MIEVVGVIRCVRVQLSGGSFRLNAYVLLPFQKNMVQYSAGKEDQWQVLTRHLARWLTGPIGLPCPPTRLAFPPPASLAPIGLSCPRGDEEGLALVLGIGLRLW